MRLGQVRVCLDDCCHHSKTQPETLAYWLCWSILEQLNKGRCVYMKQLKEFVEVGYRDYVCKLIHTIYGMMQSTHDWYETLNKTYNDLGYKASQADPCVCSKKENGNYTITDTYTDNIFGASNSDGEAKQRKEELGKVWEIKDVGENENFLGMQVQQDLNSGMI